MRVQSTNVFVLRNHYSTTKGKRLWIDLHGRLPLPWCTNAASGGAVEGAFDIFSHLPISKEPF